MIKDQIKKESDEREVFDKKQIALAIRNSTFEDELSCSLLEDQVINNCDACSLKDICKGIDRVADEYIDSTTEIVSSFDFA
ncbi:hypothetical protein ACQPU1_06325 [Clostridium paraputrificum]|uniref:hypothetical protein n=1 Tax=Clostridium paraputrificum TaxID=29363 RepID=UPI003D33CFFE